MVAYKSFDCSFKQPPKIESSLLLLRDHYWVVLHVHVTNSQHTKPSVLLACEIHTFVNLPKHGPNCCTQGEGICHNSSPHILWWIWWGWMGFQQIPRVLLIDFKQFMSWVCCLKVMRNILVKAQKYYSGQDSLIEIFLVAFQNGCFPLWHYIVLAFFLCGLSLNELLDRLWAYRSVNMSMKFLKLEEI